jgi:NhaA family Na+:H+ antiporter
LLRFTELEASSGILLIVSTLVALVWANSSISSSYFSMIHAPLTFALGGHEVSMSLQHWINDLLMSVFFLVVGLEIKREVMVGDLRKVRQATLPIAAAIGGMVVPALLYLAVNRNGHALSGWAIPMATDIAFSLGIIALLGNRVPVSLKILLTALAIVDDLGAVLVIAVVYTSSINWAGLAFAFICLGVLAICNRLGVRSLLPYMLIGLLVWAGFLVSGVHATVAGVLVAMTVPLWKRVPDVKFPNRARKIVERFDDSDSDDEREYYVGQLERVCENVQMPLQRLDGLSHPWVTFLIVPLFALANAGVQFPEDMFGAVFEPISLGVILGLVIGKPLGIVLASFLAIRLKLADLPEGLGSKHILGLGLIAGIGFTMSIFIANLAFGGNVQVEQAKIGILLASLIAGAIGFIWLRFACKPKVATAKTA